MIQRLGIVALLALCLPSAASYAGDRMGPTINPGRGDKLYRAAIQQFAPKGGGRANALAGAVHQAVGQGLDFSGQIGRAHV